MGRWREELEEVLEREEVEEEVDRCLDEEEGVLDLGVFSTCAVATEPPI